MSAQNFLAHRWLGAFLKARELDAPDGRPLYAYRCTAGERAELIRLLRRADLNSDDGRFPGAAFALFAAEAFRTGFEGGVWKWATALDPLGLEGSTNLCGPLMTRGLAYWRRPLRTAHGGSQQYLFTAVLEGGFPTALVGGEGGRLQPWLLAVQRAVDAHDMDEREAAEVAETHAGLLPESLRRYELFHLAGDLACAVRTLRGRLGPVPDEADPLTRIGAVDPGWRSVLPLEMDDEPARVLLRGLLRARPNRTEAEGFFRRVLVRADAGWEAGLKFDVSGPFATTCLPTSVKEMLDARVVRARVVAEGALSRKLDAELGLIERREDGWSFRSRRPQASSLPFAFGDAVTLALRIDGRTSVPFVVPGGAPVLDEVLVFQGEECGALAFAGGGSRSSRAERLFAAFDPNAADVRLDPGGTITDVGSIAGTGLRLHVLAGGARLVTESGTTRLATGADRDGGRAVMLLPRPAPGDVGPEPASLGMPQLAYVDGLHVARRDVRWRPVGIGGRWIPLEEAEPLGHVQIVVGQEGDVVDRLRATVLPAGFGLTVRPENANGGRIRLVELRAGRLSIQPREGLSATAAVEGADVTIEVGAEPDVTEFGATVLFANGAKAEFRLPVPRRGVAFVGADGRRLPRGVVRRVGDLAGLRVRGEEGGYVTASLRARDAGGLHFAHKLRDGASLAAIAPELRALLAETGDLDATILVEAGQSRIEVSRFEGELRRTPDGLRADALPALPGTVTVAAYSLAGEVGEEALWRGDADALSSQVFASPDRSRPWMVWVEHGGRALSRPALIPADAAPADLDPFSRCAYLPNRAERSDAMAEHLRGIAGEPTHGDWARLRTVLGAFQGRVPLMALDWFTVLARSSRSLAALAAGAETEAALASVLDLEDELPFTWEIVPFTHWFEAFGDAEAGLKAMLGPAVGLADGLIGERLRHLARLRRSLREVAAGIALLSGRDLALAPLEPSAPSQWMQDLITRNDGRGWPPLGSLDPHLADAPAVARFDAGAHPTLAAPFLAAKACRGQPYGPDVLRGIRIAKHFDPVYFEAAFAAALRDEMRRPAVR